jgi:hypothetical protein
MTTRIDAFTPRRHGRALAGFWLAGLLTLSACITTAPMGDNISYAPPVRTASGPMVLTVDVDRGRALQSIATDLQRAGFEIKSQDPTKGEIVARSGRQYLVNCGVMTQTVQGTAATINGAAPLAAIFEAGVPSGVLRREVRVATDVTVRIADDNASKATLDEKQTVTIRRLTADGGTVLSSQTLEAVKGDAMMFSDGTVCTSSGKLAEAFR